MTTVAIWNPTTKAWESPQLSLDGSVTFSGRWPRSGGWDAGCAYAVPMSAPPTDARGCSLLPSPMAQEPGGSIEDYHRRLTEHDGRESGFVPLSMVVQLLPTPTVNDAKAGASITAGRENVKPTTSVGVNLTDVARLLP